MKFKKIICILTAAVLFTVCVPVISSAEDEVNLNYIDDEVIFEYTAPTSTGKARKVQSNFKSQIEALGITELSELETYEDDSEYFTTSSVRSQTTTYVAKISGDVMETCRELEKISGVSYAEPNYLLETCGYSTPTEVTRTSGLYATYAKWYIEDVMNIKSAWEKYQTCGEGVTVAIIDNGFYLDASDFPVNLWDDGNGNHGWNTANNSSDISPVLKSDGTALDDSGHGTNVAGIIGMASNGTGGIGAAFGAELMLIKCASDVTSSSTLTKTSLSVSAVASAISYAKNNGADIISMSIGIASYPTTIKKAIDDAYSAGIILIASAGNSALGTNSSCFYPAAASNVIGVMASDKTDTSMLTSFSNYDVNDGQYYDIVAPGSYILGCSISAGNYSIMSGTSQSAPLVASCAALYLSVYPDSTVDEVYEAIKNSSSKVATSNSTVTTTTYQYKILDAVELLDYGAIETVEDPVIEVNMNSTLIRDAKLGYIYGFDENFSDISNYITVVDGTGTSEFIPTASGNGTGSVLNIYNLKGDLYISYTIIIFGDVNGDCIIDGQDAVIIDCIANDMGEYSDCIKYAADDDFDGSIGESDVLVTAGYAIGTEIISQIR